MLDQLRQHIPDGWIGAAEDDDDPETGLDPLRVVAAEMLLVTGIGATLDVLARARDSQRDRIPGQSGSGDVPLAAVWGPALIAPVAAAAHLRQSTGPSQQASRASRFLDSAVVLMGVAELATSLTGFQARKRTPSLVPLALASAGLLGLIVAHRERASTEEKRRLEKRARIVERLVPQRRPKLDRIVLHV
jgi:hypothetical protein